MRNTNRKISRRAFLQETVALAVGVPLTDILVACGGKEDIKQTSVPETKKTIKLGDEMDASLAKFGIQWTPDVHVSYITCPKENIRRYFLSGNGGITYILEGHASNDLAALVKKTPNGKLTEVWGPDKFSDNRYGYSAIASVMPIEHTNPHHLIGFTHNEEHAGANASATFTASISHIESFDGGKTRLQVGTKPIITGDDPMPPGTDVSGAGQPCAIIKDGYVYVYYVDWARKHIHHADQIYVARAKIEGDGSVGSFAFYKGNRTFAAEETDLAPVIPTPNTEPAHM